MNAYLDNAATTPLAPEALEAMLPFLENGYGNPSSIHAVGRKARAAIEKARRTVAAGLNVSPAEIFFTSGGTESDNMALRGAVELHGIRRAITSKLEHHAVLHTLEDLEKAGRIELHFVETNAYGDIDFDHLESLLKDQPKALVSLMHGNNEIGNLLDLYRTGELCREHGALFHSDTVQTVGHYAHDMQAAPVDFIVGSAHKFNGPKGVGFIYVRDGVGMPPYITGGAQERNMRGGTESVYGIVGLGRAFELSLERREAKQAYISGLKKRLCERLRERVPGVRFNGRSGEEDASLYTVLNVSLPPLPDEGGEMLLFNLDIAGVYASGGSACSSGSQVGSHVLAALDCDPARPAVRFSFGGQNTVEEIDYASDKLAELAASAKTVA